MGSERRPLELNETKDDKEDRKSAFINGGRRLGILTWKYERLPQRYQGWAPIQYRRNFLLLRIQPNGTQKDSGTGSKDVTLFRVLRRSRVHLTSFTEYNIVSIRMSLGT